MEKGMKITWSGVETGVEYHGTIDKVHPWGVLAKLDNSNLTTIPVRSSLIVRWGHQNTKTAV